MHSTLSSKLKYKILITGGAGFIGSNLVDHLLGLGHEVVCLDDLSTGFERNIEHNFDNPKFTFIKGDIRDMQTCIHAVSGCDYVSHQAALGSVPRSISDPVNTNSVNINGFLNILIAARDDKVKRFVYAASSSTYGDSKKLPKIEEEIGKPLSPYAITKYVNELYADVFAKTYGMQCIGLRYFNVFGKRQDPNGAYAAVIPLWVNKLIKHESPVINGDGSYSRDFTYIDNVLQANEKALFTPYEQILKGQRDYYNLELEEHKYLMQRAESGSRRSEDGSQRSEVGSQRSEVGPKDSFRRVQSLEFGEQKSESGVQSSESGDSGLGTGDWGLGKSMEVMNNQSPTPNQGSNLHNFLSSSFSEVFNIAYGGNTTLNQLFNAMRNNLAKFDEKIGTIEPEYGPARVGDIPHSKASIIKAETILDYSPKHDVENGLYLATEWYFENLQ